MAGLAAVPDAAVPALAALAHEVRLAWCGPERRGRGHPLRQDRGMSRRTATSARSRPRSTRRCRPRRSSTPTRCWPRPRETARARGRREFCIVLAVRGPDERTMAAHARAGAAGARARPGSTWPCRAGILTDDQARRLAAGGVHRYNHNLETARSLLPADRHHPQVGRARRDLPSWCATHGMELCCGVLLGHGRDRRPAHRAARPAARAGPDRGADQLPQPASRHAARRPPVVRAARRHPLDRAVPPRLCPTSSCATRAAARSRCASSRPWG